MKFKYYFLIIFILSTTLLIGDVQAVSYDFDITGISVSPSSPHVFHECTITVSVKHNGEADLVNDNGISDYDFNFDNFELNNITWTIPTTQSPLKTDGSITYTITGIFTDLGEKDLVFSMNSDKILPETYMIDNNIREIVDVVPAEDMFVESIELNPPYPGENEDVVVTVKVKNNGKDDIVNNFGMQSYRMTIDDFILDNENIPWIDTRNRILVEEYGEYTYEGKFKSTGQKTAKFEIDVIDEVEEYNEDNNSKEVSFTIGGDVGRDILIEDFSVSSLASELVKGEEYSISVKLKNSGDISLTEERGLIFTDYIYDFPGLSVESYSYPAPPTPEDPLNPNEYFTYSFTVIPNKIGAYTLTFAADTSNRIKESDETNNSSSTEIFIYETQEKADEFSYSNIEIVKFSSSSIEVNWNTSKKVTAHVELKTGHYNYNSYLTSHDITSWPTSSNKTNHSAPFNNLNPSAGYIMKIIGENGEVEKTSDEVTFTMPSSDNISFVGSPIMEVTQSENKVKMSWTTDLAGTSKIYYKKIDDSSYTNSGGNDYLVTHSTEVAGLGAGEYLAYAYSKTTTNTEISSQIYSFTIIGDAPISPPEEETPTTPPDEVTPSQTQEPINITNKSMYGSLKGKILLQVEANGEAYYLSPGKEEMYFLGRPDDAFQIMREQGIGIISNDLNKIPIGMADLSGEDSDSDGLSDIFEDAVGTDKNSADTDLDGHGDKIEIVGGYNPKGAGQMNSDSVFSEKQKGKIFLAVEQNGEAWYINPIDSKRYFLGRPADAFAVMRELGLGISNVDFSNLK